MKLLLAALATLFVLPAWAEEQVRMRTEPLVEPEWELARLYLKKRGKTYFRGHALYMTESSRPAIGFTCQKKQVFAFVSVEPMSIGETFEKWFRNPAEWKVQFQINDEPVRDETWIWTYRGRGFLSRAGDSANDLFNAARSGATLMFHRHRGDPVTMEIPQDLYGQFEYFVEKCGLEMADAG